MTSLRSRFDPSMPGGRRLIVQLTLVLMLLSRLLSYVYGYMLLGTWDIAWLRIVLLLLLILLGQWRKLSLEVWGLICVGVFAWAAREDIQSSLIAQTLPRGLSLWTPAVLLECFLLLGASYGAVLVSLLGVMLVMGFVLFPPQSVDLLQAWFHLILSCVLFCVLGYGFSRFLERVDQESVSTTEALSRARMDALTRVLGRAAIENELSLSCTRAQQQKMPLSLIVCDIDHFKRVNDQHGHAKGDDVLRAVAQKLRHNTATIGAKVGRWGGEEFVIVVPRYARNDAVTLANQIRRDIESSLMAGLPITLSLGVASYRHGEEVSSLFERADQALYRAKEQGRNRVESL